MWWMFSILVSILGGAEVAYALEEQAMQTSLIRSAAFLAVLIGLSVYLRSRKHGLKAALGAKDHVVVCDVKRIGPKTQLVVVEFEGRKRLLGVHDQGITVIDEQKIEEQTATASDGNSLDEMSVDGRMPQNGCLTQ